MCEVMKLHFTIHSFYFLYNIVQHFPQKMALQLDSKMEQSNLL
jgi:hypothetical protein